MRELRELGAELHGEHWIGPTARDLDIDRATLAKWESGKKEFYDGGFMQQLRELVKSHRAAVARVRAMAAKRKSASH